MPLGIQRMLDFQNKFNSVCIIHIYVYIYAYWNDQFFGAVWLQDMPWKGIPCIVEGIGPFCGMGLFWCFG